MGIFSSKTDDKKTPQKDDLGQKNKETKEESKSMKDLYAEEVKGGKKEEKKSSFGRAYRVLVKPMVTEKATNLSSENQYVFMVDIDANKIDVARAIFEVYGVKPVSINMIKSKGKTVRRGRITGRRKDFKKAIVKLKKGETISVYEGV
jgi:large subunit ribosomal protein L23